MAPFIAFLAVAAAAATSVIAQTYPEKGDAWRISIVADPAFNPQLSELNGAYLRENYERPGYYLAYGKNHSETTLGHDFITLKSDWGNDYKTIWNKAMKKCLKDDTVDNWFYGWTFVDPSEGCPKWILDDSTANIGRSYLSRDNFGSYEFNVHGPQQPAVSDGFTVTHCGTKPTCFGNAVRMAVEHERTG